jgi:hypothetical protein
MHCKRKSSIGHLLAAQRAASKHLHATCRWFHKHRSSISTLRLSQLYNDRAANGLRESFILALFGILSTTLKRLVVINCKHVRGS